MTHDELLWAINSVVENGTCETVGHYSSAKALRAVVELHKPIEPHIYLEEDEKYLICNVCMEFDEDIKYPCPTIQAIEKELG